MGRARVGFQ